MSGVGAIMLPCGRSHAASDSCACCFLRVGSAVVLEQGSGVRSVRPRPYHLPVPPSLLFLPPCPNNRAMGVGGSLGYWLTICLLPGRICALGSD